MEGRKCFLGIQGKVIQHIEWKVKEMSRCKADEEERTNQVTLPMICYEGSTNVEL